MKAVRNKLMVILAGAVGIGALPLRAIAQEEGAPTDAQAAMKSDKTGTNPINFTFDARLYNEYQWLNADGGGHQNLTTFEFRAPTLGGKLQVRVKARYVDIAGDWNDDGKDEVNESGFGDMDLRLLTVPYMNMEKKFAIAAGLEAFLNTASEDVLGSGAVSLGPQVFAVFFKPFGGLFDLAAPAYQHKISVYEESGRSDVHQGFIDVFFLKMSENKQFWTLINPTFIMDYENHSEFLNVDVEIGGMLDKIFKTQGHSVYVRPGFQVGADRPVDGSLEVCYKIIW